MYAPLNLEIQKLFVYYHEYVSLFGTGAQIPGSHFCYMLGLVTSAQISNLLCYWLVGFLAIFPL